MELSDMNKMVTGGPQSFDRLRFRVNDIINNRDKLNPMSKDFADTLERMRDWNKLDKLTRPQEKYVYSLWTDLHSKGIVKLPKGMV